MAQRASIIGAGPAGLIAAEILSARGWAVTVYDHMPSIGRKFLMAGRGGLNLTHSEPFERFVARYDAPDWVRPILAKFTPNDLIAWAHGLGQDTFVGSSGRVFPLAMKASPLLRAWLRRLEAQNVDVRLRYRWRGWDDNDALIFDGPDGAHQDRPDATVLALGGGSWAKLGSDGSWTDILRARGVPLTPLTPSNCGILISWSEPFRARFAGAPLNAIAVTANGRRMRGEAVVTETGLEGGAIYGLSAAIREGLHAGGGATPVSVDLRPDLSEGLLVQKLDGPRRGESASNFLRKRVGLAPVAINLLRETGLDLNGCDGPTFARSIKSVSLSCQGLAAIDRAISSAGGVSRTALDADLRIKGLDSVFAAGEMIDWDAPTGGYLLQLCFSSGVHVARRISGN